MLLSQMLSLGVTWGQEMTHESIQGAILEKAPSERCSRRYLSGMRARHANI